MFIYLVLLPSMMALVAITREEFLANYDKPKTLKKLHAVFYNWDNFILHMATTEADLLHEIRQNPKDVYRILNHLVQFWKRARHPKVFARKRHPSSIRGYFNFVVLWLSYNDITIDRQKIKLYVKFPKAEEDMVEGVDGAMIKRFIDTCNDTHRGLWYFQAYSGMRIESETLNMTWEWVDLSVSPATVRIPARFSKTRQERSTFVGLEAEAYLRAEAERLRASGSFDPAAKVFGGITYNSAWGYFARRREKLGFTKRRSSGTHHYRPHVYRGYTQNKLERGGGKSFAETILGHKKGLIQYNQAGGTEEDKRRDYEASLKFLAVSQERALETENQMLREKVESIDDMKRKIAEYEDRMKRLEAARK